MSKTRVYELAQQLGVDNKEVMSRLAAERGVTVKNHMAVIEDADVKALSTPVHHSAKEVAAQEEVRVKPTLIRRRKVVDAHAEAAQA